MHRPTIGAIAVLLLGTAAVLWLGSWGADVAGLMSASFRIGSVMAVLWLAEPQLRKFPAWVFPAVCVMLVLAVLFRRQPMLFVVALVILAAAVIVRPRGKGPPRRTR
ncbi:MAG: hypothetical protein AB7O62_12900 [Pirellulales bacterium]